MLDIVPESYTLQVLPPGLRAKAVRGISAFVAPSGTLLVIARGREPSDPGGKMPWTLTKEEMSLFETHGLKEVSLELGFGICKLTIRCKAAPVVPLL